MTDTSRKITFKTVAKALLFTTGSNRGEEKTAGVMSPTQDTSAAPASNSAGVSNQGDRLEPSMRKISTSIMAQVKPTPGPVQRDLGLSSNKMRNMVRDKIEEVNETYRKNP